MVRVGRDDQKATVGESHAHALHLGEELHAYHRERARGRGRGGGGERGRGGGHRRGSVTLGRGGRVFGRVVGVVRVEEGHVEADGVVVGGVDVDAEAVEVAGVRGAVHDARFGVVATRDDAFVRARVGGGVGGERDAPSSRGRGREVAHGAGGGGRWWRATPRSRGGGGRRARARTTEPVGRAFGRDAGNANPRRSRRRPREASFDPRDRRGGEVGRTGISSTTLARRGRRRSAQRAYQLSNFPEMSHPPDPRRSRTRRIVAPDILWRAAHSTRAVSRRRRARTRPGAYRALASPRVIRVARRFSSRASPSVASRGAALGSRNSDWRIRAEPPTHGRPRGHVHGRIVPRRRPSGRRRTRSSLLRGAGAGRRRPFRGRSRGPRRGPRRRRRKIHRATRPRARRANLRHARRPRPRRLRPRRSDLRVHHPGRRSRRARVPRRRRRDAIPRLRG